MGEAGRGLEGFHGGISFAPSRLSGEKKFLLLLYDDFAAFYSPLFPAVAVCFQYNRKGTGNGIDVNRVGVR